MTVVLLPPTTGSVVSLDVEALAVGPRFLRTRTMSRWHRPRSGSQHGNRACYTAWCGYTIGSSTRAPALTTDEIPDGELVCATCEGRAIGAGQEQQNPGRRLVFRPRELQRPKHCPGSRSSLYTALSGGTTGQCLACADTHPLRAMGGPYASRYAIVQHPPGAGLIAPCPFHRWRQLVRDNDGVRCSCGRTTPAPKGTR
jgi:hypothetical protein